MRKKIVAGMLGISMMVYMCGCQNGQMAQDATQTVASAVQGKNEAGTQINLQDNNITTDSELVTVEDNVVTITTAGTYVLSGELSDGRIVVEAAKEDDVELVLNGVYITCSYYSPIQVLQAGNVTVDLAEQSVNILTDGSSYALTDEEDTTDGVIFSKDDLKLKGDGTLYINSNYKHGIVGKDDIEIKSGTYIIQAVEDGVNANDSITIEGGTFTLAVGDDGMHVDELFTINAGIITIAESMEGLEGHQVIINDGIIDITATDDGINSNNGDDSETSDAEVNIEADGTTETLPQDMGTPPEMPEGGVMPEESMMQQDRSIPEGDMTDRRAEWTEDGITATRPGGERMQWGGQGQGMMGGREMMMDADADSSIQIHGGTITVDAGGDGLDSNGYLDITGGTLYVSGAANNGNSAIDYGIEATISGGMVIATGFSGMAEAFSDNSTQYCVRYNMQNTQKGGTQIVVKDSAGKEVLSWTPKKEFNSIILSSPEMKEGEEYTIEFDGNAEAL